MKHLVLTLSLAAAAFGARAQAITDTVSVGPGYANQVWYSLPNNEQGTRPRAEWDLAFDLRNITSGLLNNAVSGVTVWKYWKGNLASGWANVDTTGLAARPARYNSDTSWALGAIGRYANPNDPNNLDWGTYDMSTHFVIGDSFYIVKLASGAYKKFAVESLKSGVFTFKHANLDGTGAQTQTLAKSAYTGKNFVYVNLTANTLLDREPAAADWDLLFTQYTATLPGNVPYTVTGILQKQGVQVVKVSNLPNAATDTSWQSRTFSTAINGIGYDWKSLNFSTNTYTIKDSTLYFVKRTNGDVWKMVMKGFGGTATGNSWFTKEKLYTATTTPPPASVGTTAASAPTVLLYPNPASGSDVYLVYDVAAATAQATVRVQDLTGRTVYAAALDAGSGLHTTLLPASRLAPGTYLVLIDNGTNRAVQKLLIP